MGFFDTKGRGCNKAIVSSVNFSEVVTVLTRNGFGQEQVIKQHGLSFGDRACLALAKYKNLPVLTADKIWKKLDLDIKIQLIRGSEVQWCENVR